MKSTRLLLKNAFRSASKVKIQIIGLSLLIMFMAIIVSIISTTNTQVVGKKDYLNRRSNLRHALVDTKSLGQVTIDENEGITDKVQNQELFYQYLVNKVSEDETNDLKFSWSRTEARSFSKMKSNGEEVNMKVLVKTEKQTNGQDGKPDVDSLIIEQGSSIEKKSDIVINKEFANKNKIAIGDVIRIEKDVYGDTLKISESLDQLTDEKEKADLKEFLKKVKSNNLDPLDSKYKNMAWFKVVGFGLSADFISPIIDETTVLPDTRLNFIGYVKYDNFGLKPYHKIAKDGTEPVKSEFDGLYVSNISESRLYGSDYGRETYFSVKFENYESNSAEKLQLEILGRLKTKKQNQFVYDVKDQNYKFSNRVIMLDNVVKAYIITSNVLLIATALISLFVLAIILKKQVTDMQTQIGCLKSLGYKKRELLNNFMAVPLICSFIGSVIGYLFSLGFGPLVIGIFQKFFNLSYGSVTFSWVSLFITFLIFWSFVTAVTLVFTILLIKKSALILLSGTVDKKISILSRIFKKMFSGKSFASKLRASLLVGSSRKFVATIFIFLMSSILLSFSISSLFIVKENQKKTFSGLNYNYVAEYNSVVTDNPQTLLKFYNPEISEENPGNRWGFDEKKKLSEGSLSPISVKKEEKKPDEKPDKPNEIADKAKKIFTSYPTKEVDGKIVYDTNYIYDQLISKNIPAQYYELNFLEKSDASQWARFSNLNYINLSFSLLKAIDEYGSQDLDFISQIALPLMLDQWLDFLKYQELIKIKKDDPNINDEKLKRETAKILVNFYEKYTNGLPLTFKKKFLTKNEEGQFFVAKDKELKKDLKEELKKGKEKFSLIAPVADKASNLKDIIENSNNYQKYFDKLNEAKITRPEDFIFFNNSDKLLPIQVSKIDFDDNPDIKTKIDFDFLNSQLTIWYNTTFFKRLPLIVLQTSYSRAPYYVQQNMKTAYEDNRRYEMMFNTVPYIANKDILGTMVKGKINDSEFNIYGVPTNVDKVIDFKGELPKIFVNNPNLDDAVPIIVNKSFTKKYGLKKDSVFDSSLFVKKTSIDENDDLDFKFGRYEDGKIENDNRLYNTNFTEIGSNSYYSINNKNYASELTGDIAPVYVNYDKDKKVDLVRKDPNSAKDKPSQVHQKYLAGKAIIKEQEKNQRFKIVAIQDSFGKPQGWIDQEIANRILGLDILRDKVFAEWFLSDIFLNKDFEQYMAYKTQNPNAMNQFRSLVDSIEPQDKYQKIDNLLTSRDLNDPSYLKVICDLFNSTYPIFNFKYSTSSTIHEIQSQVSISQEFGDFSSIGLNGGNIKAKDFENDKNDDEADDQDDDQEQIRVRNNGDETIFVDGAGVTSIKTAMPTFEAQKILAQLTTIVNLIMMMFTILAFTISLIIILLVTSIIIHEKKAFIAIMKLLGYSSFYVVRQIVSIYFWVLVTTTICGFITSYFTIGYATLSLAQTTQWVLPYQFNLLVPVLLFTIMFTIYMITTAIALTQVRKINPVIITGFNK